MPSMIPVPNTTIDAVDCVFRALENHKEQLVNRMFPNTTASYKAEWRNRDPYAFWCHLDLLNQKRCIQIAVAIYRE